jgi:signal transduction histidine kinase
MRRDMKRRTAVILLLGVTIRCYPRRGGVAFEVVDCGCGIPVEQRTDIFFPFFTTKKEGTGLGLPNAEKIVEAHGGYMEVLDNPQRGLTFRVVIPNTLRQQLGY